MAPSLLLPVVMSAILIGLASGVPLQLGGRQLAPTCDAYALATLQPVLVSEPVINLIWVGAEDQVVFAITARSFEDSRGVWRSMDGGSKWEELTPALNSSIGGNETVNIIEVFSQKSQPGNVVFIGAGTFMWVSHDYGATLTPVQTPGMWRGSSIKQLKQHPRKDNWLLALVKRPNCRRSLDMLQMECPHDLWLTEDLYNGGSWASKWQNLTDTAQGKVLSFVEVDWGVSACPSNNCTSLAVMDDRSIFATLYEPVPSYEPFESGLQFVVSTNLFSTYTTQIRCGNMFQIIGHTIYLAFANSCPIDVTGNIRQYTPSKGITLYTSVDGGSTFDQACLPIALKEQDGFQLMETHDSTGAIIIVDFRVPIGFMDVPASSVYTAGPHHALFSLSLTDVFHADFGFSIDFSRVEGIPGVYIANQMLPRQSPDDGYATGDYTDLSELSGAPLVETRITFNGGAQWQRIPAPTRINNPECDRCDGQPQCFLHLHGMSSWDGMSTELPAVYSNPSAPGLVMATGNVGPVGVGLDYNDGLCTWLSSDGGSTWQDVGAGTYIYQFADWGGMVVMVRHPGVSGKPAEEVLFSLDYGRCWHSAPLDQALLVDNIRIEPGAQRPRVIVHGRACHQSSSTKCSYSDDGTRSAPEGLVYVVDVQDLLETVSPLAPCADDDYTTWTLPTTEANAELAQCVLGKVMRFTHRKRDSKCINGPAYQRPVPANTSCACELTDVECDFGYIRDGSKCIPIPSDRMPSCPAVASKKYSVSSTGLRLVHADQCSGIETIIKDTDGKGKLQRTGRERSASHKARSQTKRVAAPY